MNALIVEPSHFVAGVLSGICAKHGLGVRLAGSGQEGLAKLADGNVDLILLAYELGDMNGCEFFTQVKTLRKAGDIPGVMFAATHDHDRVSEALEAGITECFAKRELRRLEEFVEHFVQSASCRFTGRAMLVEDSRTAALFARRVLEEMGLEVEVFASAEEAIDAYRQDVYDLVLTDYVLAGSQSALSLIRDIRHAPGRKAATPILAMSSLLDTTRKVEILRNGANDFVFKPVVAEELRVRVGNLLANQQLMRRLEAQSQAMKDMAMRDQLTSLHNRHYLRDVLPRRFEAADRAGADLSLVLADIDHFKRVNDEYGHDTGDKVLVEVAQTLAEGLAGEEVLARYGGEEFVLLLPDTPLDVAVHRAEVLRQAVAALEPAGLRMTASFGVATRHSGETYEQLFRRADNAVYRAKEDGRNRVKFSR